MMAALGSAMALMILLGWIAFALLGIGFAAPLTVWLGIAFGVLCVVFLRETTGLRGMVALLAPFGIMLPALALRHMAGHLGLAFTPFHTGEILIFLLLYLAFLAAAMGALPLDIYRLGFAPLPVALMVLALVAYGAAQGSLFIPALAVLGQLIWVLGWGSSNWFDHMLHVALIPVAIVVLILRLT